MIIATPLKITVQGVEIRATEQLQFKNVAYIKTFCKGASVIDIV